MGLRGVKPGIRTKKCSNKYVGVTLNKGSWQGYKKFMVRITVLGVHKIVGSCDDEREAALMYDRVAIRHGMPTNILKKVA